MAPINHYDFESHSITEVPNSFSFQSVPKVNKVKKDVKKDVPKKQKRDKVSYFKFKSGFIEQIKLPNSIQWYTLIKFCILTASIS